MRRRADRQPKRRRGLSCSIDAWRHVGGDPLLYAASLFNLTIYSYIWPKQTLERLFVDSFVTIYLMAAYML